MAEIHSRAVFVRQVSELPDETKVQVQLRNSFEQQGEMASPGGDCFSFVGDKSDEYEIGQECTIIISK